MLVSGCTYGENLLLYKEKYDLPVSCAPPWPYADPPLPGVLHGVSELPLGVEGGVGAGSMGNWTKAEMMLAGGRLNEGEGGGGDGGSNLQGLKKRKKQKYEQL
jgi:hypothetical protein